MKYLIASDLHGSAVAAEKILQAASRDGVDFIILLGDIYNHGPRNPLPEGYDPLKTADLLNGEVDRLIVVKGNCDSEVDTVISRFDFISDICLSVGGKNFFLTHGNVYNIDNPPKTKFDAVIYGHFHTCFVKKKNTTSYVNVGSVSLPKDGTPKSYLLLDDERACLKEIDGKEIESFIL